MEIGSACQVLPAVELGLFIKSRRLDWCVVLVKWVQGILHVELVHFGAKVLDAVLVLHVMQDEKAHAVRRDECRHKPFVELVDHFQVHIVGGPHALVHQVKRGVSDELAEITVVFLVSLLVGGMKLHLVDGIIKVPDDHEVI